MKHKLLIIIIFSLFLSLGHLQGAVRYHCPSDSVKVLELISKAKEGDTFGHKVVMAAKYLQGTPFAQAADNDSIGTLVIRLDSLNQREFIYNVLAAAKTAELSAPTLRDFEKNLENISRRKGTDEGFVSQFFYGSDWIVDNVFRGNLKEMTEYVENGNYRTKTLDYLTRHPEQFPALSNPAVLDKVKVIEFGFRSHRIPHLKKQSINNKNIKELISDGDIIILNPLEDDFDIYDIGFVSMEKGEPTLIHLPSENSAKDSSSKDQSGSVPEVILDPYPLSRLFKIQGQFFYGFRWLRPIE